MRPVQKPFSESYLVTALAGRAHPAIKIVANRHPQSNATRNRAVKDKSTFGLQLDLQAFERLDQGFVLGIDQLALFPDRHSAFALA